ncbi:type I toxin-antitoxin system Ibs family toxin [Escherichia coli]|nr:type I toxin-antitoxin system Ibs family toxin [Escherichia coli]AXZ45330.1 type I toxin-antitoxin system Ibs family toxin [Escherichia coli]EFK3622432.1 type I toxin-antitoxin system Ibs family toxin [Escherichia coli]ELB5055111.1 type I toxin-antitoxin system Ibs family toxin [Escherichia coli]ELB6714246.1 type I toxin-antitoxin system Ibs family toxin [Escherichia coli]ELH2238172.1 type I toxin-antitoxin system Ibs family toxin [Escherichia coli]
MMKLLIIVVLLVISVPAY